MTPTLAGVRVLIVEDEFLIADELAFSLGARGAQIAGPCANVRTALALIRSGAAIDAAVLDFKLGNEDALAIADELHSRGIPFVFATGCESVMIPPRYRAIARCDKPTDMVMLVGLLAGVGRMASA